MNHVCKQGAKAVANRKTATQPRVLLSFVILLMAALVGAGCTHPSEAPAPAGDATIRALATTSYLADIAQNVAGERFTVGSLIPSGADPHVFEPSPSDARRLADSDLLIANGAGFESFLERLVESTGRSAIVVEASSGLTSRKVAHDDEGAGDKSHGHEDIDPHFWLDPTLAIRYVENIRNAFTQADPEGRAAYAANATVYIAKLRELDAWIAEQLQQIPPERRLLVTNHESFGYYADRYGLKIVGTVIPGVSTGASPSAQQLSALVDRVKRSGAPAIFLESGANPQLAQQLAREAGIPVVTELYTHSLTAPDGRAPDYLSMMRHNTQAIVEALK